MRSLLFAMWLLTVPTDGFVPPLVMQERSSAPLVASLRRVSKWQGEIVVVKYGGHAMTNDERAAEFASDITLLQSLGVRPVVVHGGGPQIRSMLRRLGPGATRDVVEVSEMVLGRIGKNLAAAIGAAGGLSLIHI